MMDAETITALAGEAAEIAEELEKEPYFVQFGWELEDCPPFPFPNLGSYCPEGWEEIDRLFVDKMGSRRTDSEMSAHGCHGMNELLDWIEIDHGYAIVTEGQFQLYIGKFKRLEDVNPN